MINKVLVVDFYASPFSYDHFGAHRVVVTGLILLDRIEVGMIASLYPHVELCIVSPAATHQLSCRQELLGLGFVDIKHEEK